MAKFIALVSGKGGAGKTTSTLNIGQALVHLGKKVIVLDANLVTPNLALQLGYLDPKGNVNKFLRKENNLKEIIYSHEGGLSVIPASPSYVEFQKTNSQSIGEIFHHLENLADFVLIDSPSGLGEEVSEVLKNCDEAVIIVNPNTSSVMDALKTIRLAEKHETSIAGVLLNMSNKGRHELNPKEVETILGQMIVANVPQHKKFRKALHKQMPLTHLYKRSKPAKEFTKMASFLSLDNEMRVK
ncbi:MAG: P-loop NTPase [Candidatus Woesearchaeota archaeon]